MSINISEENPTQSSGGADKAQKQAKQLAYDVRYKVRQKMGGKKTDAASLKRAYLQQLAQSPSPGPVKRLAKKMLIGEQYDFVDIDSNLDNARSNVIRKVFVEKNIEEYEEEIIEGKTEKKYQIRVTDKKTGKVYTRMADRGKIGELRKSGNVSSVEMTGYGYDKTKKKAKKDFDGDGKVESPKAEYKGSKDKAIKKAIAKEGYQKDPEKLKKDKTHSKQPDPSKDGFTGIGNMSIKDIMKMNKKMKKEEVELEESEKVAQGAQKRATELGAKRRQASYKKYGSNVGSPGKNERAGYNLARKARSSDSSPETQVTKKKKPAGFDTSQTGHERKRDEKTSVGKSGKKLKTPKYKLSFKDRQTHHTRSAFNRKDPKQNPKHTANTQKEEVKSLSDTIRDIVLNKEHHQTDAKGKVIEHGDGTPSSVEEKFIGEVVDKTIVSDDDKKIDVMKGKNKIKINPSVGEQVEVEKEDPSIEKKQQRVSMMKRQILQKKMQAVRSGAGADIVAHTEQEGEMVEGIGDAVKKGVKRHKDAVEKKKIKNRKAVPYAALAAENQPEGEMVEDYYSGTGEKVQSRTLAWMRKKGQKGSPGLNAMKAREAEHKAKRGVKEEAGCETKSIENKGKKKIDPNKNPVVEAKVDKGRSDYGKATIRNWRHSGPDTVEPAMFDPENKRGKTIDKRREEHKARRGVKTKSVKEGVIREEDKAFNYVLAKLRKKHGDGVLTKGDKIKPQSAADKAKARAHQAKVDAENAAERKKDPSQGRYPKGYSNRGSD